MKNLLLRSSRLLLPVILLFVCFACNSAPRGHELKAGDFKKKLEETPTAQLVDVRTPQEYAEGHLQNAKNIDWNNEGFADQAAMLDKNKPVFVYCLAGGRSAAAAQSLRTMGFKEVYEMEGGMMKWRKEGLPEEGGNAATAKVDGMTVKEYNALLAAHQQVLVDIYAPWCGPCKKMAPFIAEIEKEQQDRVMVLRINADDNEALMKKIGVDALPTIFVYQAGKQTWKTVGYVEKEEILKHIK